MTRPSQPKVGGVHACPHCRRPAVPDYLYCCSNCWRMLPADVRLAILTTARMNVLQPARRAAFAAANEAYAEAVTKRRDEIEARRNERES